MATTLVSQSAAAGVDKSAVALIDQLTSELQTEDALLSALRDRGASLESEITSLREERTELLCKLADTGNGADARTKSQKRIDAVDERLRNLEREQEGLRLLMSKAEAKTRGLRDELAESRRQEAEEQRLSRVRELALTLNQELNTVVLDFEQMTSRIGRLYHSLEELGELGNDARQIGQRIKARLEDLTPASLSNGGWQFVQGREIRILPMLPPRTDQ